MVTVDDLKDLQHLPGEISQIERAIETLKRPSFLKGMRTAQREECTAALIELIGIYQDRRQMCAAQLDRLQAFMDSIEDDFTRELFRLRYEDGREWLQVWNAVEDWGFHYEPETLRQICRRYIERYNRNGTE